jgi:hypothetical protein
MTCTLGKPVNNAVVEQYIELLKPLVASGWHDVYHSINKGLIKKDSNYSICRFFEEDGEIHSIYIRLGLGKKGGGCMLLLQSDIAGSLTYHIKQHISLSNLTKAKEAISQIAVKCEDGVDIKITTNTKWTCCGFAMGNRLLYDTHQEALGFVRVSIVDNNYDVIHR